VSAQKHNAPQCLSTWAAQTDRRIGRSAWAEIWIAIIIRDPNLGVEPENSNKKKHLQQLDVLDLDRTDVMSRQSDGSVIK
jgi:hypothetical protein